MGFFKKKKKEGEIKAFATGDIIALKDVKDQMFSAGLMGQGIAIESDDGKFKRGHVGKRHHAVPNQACARNQERRRL